LPKLIELRNLFLPVLLAAGLCAGRADSPLDLIARSHPTPEQLAGFLNTHLTFQEDLSLFGQEDYWQAPEEVLARGRGDCEDYASLAADLLGRQGVGSFLFSLYGGKGYAHTVCVFVEGGRYSVLNQDRLLRYRAASLEELAGKLCRAWEWGAVAERHGHRGRAVRVIRRDNSSRD
jgi:hypothetical protein